MKVIEQLEQIVVREGLDGLGYLGLFGEGEGDVGEFGVVDAYPEGFVQLRRFVGVFCHF